MEMTVRYGTFETNSSSMHSLVITKSKGEYNTDELEDCWYTSDGTVNLYDGDLEFDRAPFDVLTTPLEKAAYASASLCAPQAEREERNEAERIFSEIEQVIVNLIPSIKHIELPNRYEKIYYNEDRDIVVPYVVPENVEWKYDDKLGVYTGYKDADGVQVPLDCVTCERKYYGRVDHASKFLLKDFLDKKNITLEDFITHREYVVIIDGDEYDTFGKLEQSGLINSNMIVSMLTAGTC